VSDILKRVTRLEARLAAADGWDKEAVAFGVANTIERLSRGERREIPPEDMERLVKLAERFFPKPKL